MFAQSQRLQLFEEFTGENCGPCAQTNPALNALLHDAANETKIVAIKYQSPIPSAGPIYNSYKLPSDNRLAYYQVNSAPNGRHNGQLFATSTTAPGHPYYFSQDDIDASAAVTSPFDLTVTHQISPGYDSIYVTVNAKATGAVSGDLKLRVAVIENFITFTTPPGSNGEKVFEDVCRKMLPDPNGSAMPGTLAVNDEFNVSFAWKLDKIYDLTQVAVVAFIQDDNTQDVHQAAKSNPVPLQLDGKLTAVSGVNLFQCTDKINPVLSLYNNGVATITSCEITYKVGAGANQTYTWNGSIANGESADVMIPEITATSGAQTISFTITKVNETADAVSGNSITKTANVLLTSTPAPTTETFQSASSTAFPVNGCFINNPGGNDTWILATGAGGFATGTSQKSTKMIMYFGEQGEIDEFHLAKIDASALGVSTAYLNFDYAHCGVAADPTTELQAMISNDCGATWTTIGTLDGAALKTAPNTNQYFNAPTKTQWKNAHFQIANANTMNELMVKLVAVTGTDGNNLFLDNINVADKIINTGVEEVEALQAAVSVFPNPAKGNVSVKLENGATATGVQLIDNLGRVVNVNASGANGTWNLNLDNVASGIYTVQVVNNTEVVAVSKLKVD